LQKSLLKHTWKNIIPPGVENEGCSVGNRLLNDHFLLRNKRDNFADAFNMMIQRLSPLNAFFKLLNIVGVFFNHSEQDIKCQSADKQPNAIQKSPWSFLLP
jgi:hypothetical protein